MKDSYAASGLYAQQVPATNGQQATRHGSSSTCQRGQRGLPAGALGLEARLSRSLVCKRSVLEIL